MPASMGMDHSKHNASCAILDVLTMWSREVTERTGSLRRLLRTKRNAEEARMIIDMLVHRLRDDGPQMQRGEIRDRLLLAAGKLNEVAPRSVLRNEA